jgi:hypothetical protein
MRRGTAWSGLAATKSSLAATMYSQRLDLLAQTPGTDLEMLKRIQELDPTEKPDDTQEP